MCQDIPPESKSSKDGNRSAMTKVMLLIDRSLGQAVT